MNDSRDSFKWAIACYEAENLMVTLSCVKAVAVCTLQPPFQPHGVGGLSVLLSAQWAPQWAPERTLRPDGTLRKRLMKGTQERKILMSGQQSCQSFICEPPPRPSVDLPSLKGVLGPKGNTKLGPPTFAAHFWRFSLTFYSHDASLLWYSYEVLD